MILVWMITAAGIAVAGALAGVALERALWALGRPTRWAWAGSLGFSALWPCLLFAHSRLDTPSSTTAFYAMPAMLVRAEHGAIALAGRYGLDDGLSARVVLTLWLATTAALLVRLVWGITSVRRARRAWPVQDVLGVSVLVSPDTGPAVIGVTRPRVVVPAWVLALEPSLLSVVLEHEAEHVRAHDVAMRLFAALITTILPWNPALWWESGRLALAIETDCDARLLRRRVSRQRYARLLLAIAQRATPTILATALTEPTSHLERRIRAMNTGLPRRRLLIAGASTLLAVGVLLLACAAPTPGGPESSSADAGITSARSALPTDRQSGGYHDFQVSKQARVYPNSPAPVYPAALEKSRTPGTVITEFVVDTNGRVDTSTVKVDSSTNEAFTASVREVLPKLRFYPAEVGGRHVKELIKLPWAFAVGQ